MFSIRKVFDMATYSKYFDQEKKVDVQFVISKDHTKLYTYINDKFVEEEPLVNAGPAQDASADFCLHLSAHLLNQNSGCN